MTSYFTKQRQYALQKGSTEAAVKDLFEFYANFIAYMWTPTLHSKTDIFIGLAYQVLSKAIVVISILISLNISYY